MWEKGTSLLGISFWRGQPKLAYKTQRYIFFKILFINLFFRKQGRYIHRWKGMHVVPSNPRLSETDTIEAVGGVLRYPSFLQIE